MVLHVTVSPIWITLSSLLAPGCGNRSGWSGSPYWGTGSLAWLNPPKFFLHPLLNADSHFYFHFCSAGPWVTILLQSGSMTLLRHSPCLPGQLIITLCPGPPPKGHPLPLGFQFLENGYSAPLSTPLTLCASRSSCPLLGLPTYILWVVGLIRHYLYLCSQRYQIPLIVQNLTLQQDVEVWYMMGQVTSTYDMGFQSTLVWVASTRC
jgi:hypothetical protein